VITVPGRENKAASLRTAWTSKRKSSFALASPCIVKLNQTAGVSGRSGAVIRPQITNSTQSPSMTIAQSTRYSWRTSSWVKVIGLAACCSDDRRCPSVVFHLCCTLSNEADDIIGEIVLGSNSAQVKSWATRFLGQILLKLTIALTNKEARPRQVFEYLKTSIIT
jgi:hypothetical protein